MAVEVTVPEEFLGTIIGDINSRRGRIESMEHAAGSQVVKAMVDFVARHGFTPFAWWRIVVGVIGLGLVWGGLV